MLQKCMAPFLGVDEDAVRSPDDAFSDTQMRMGVYSLVTALVWTGKDYGAVSLDASCCVEHARAHLHIRFLDIRKHDGIVG